MEITAPVPASMLVQTSRIAEIASCDTEQYRKVKKQIKYKRKTVEKKNKKPTDHYILI